MATERLIVELDAKTAKLDASLKETERRLDRLDGTVKKTDKSFSNFTKEATIAAAALTTVAAVVATASREAASFAKELQIASNRTGDSVERLQQLSFASNTVGISLEKLGDIGKDTNEKIGEFLVTGGGGFKDFVDIMELTEKEARKVADEFSRMSGTEVLQAMVTQMEAAGISSNKMSFALEGVASDTTDLIPLLTNGGEKLNTLSDAFDDLKVTLTAIDLEKIRKVGEEFDKFSESFAASSRKLVADYSDEIIKALGVISVFGEQSVNVLKVIGAGWGGLIDVAGAAINDMVNGVSTFDAALEEASESSKEALANLLGEDFYQMGVDAGVLMAQGIADGNEQNSGKIMDIVVKGGKQLTDWEKTDKKQRQGIYDNFVSASSKLSEQYMEDNKGVRSALVIMDTAAGIQRAFAESNFWVALGQSAVIAASGLAQLSNIQSAGKGGGTISAGGGGGGISNQSQQASNDDIATLEFTDASATGSTTEQVTFATDTGDELMDVIADGLNKGQAEGRFS